MILLPKRCCEQRLLKSFVEDSCEKIISVTGSPLGDGSKVAGPPAASTVWSLHPHFSLKDNKQTKQNKQQTNINTDKNAFSYTDALEATHTPIQKK